jgi:DNA-binding transcriptional MerR regulator/effector-binding domain-containing protein
MSQLIGGSLAFVPQIILIAITHCRIETIEVCISKFFHVLSDENGRGTMNERLLSVNNFAKKARVTLATLHHYDQMGILSPIRRGENGYRYYSLTQLSEIAFIRVLQKSGMSLGDIKLLKEERTPKKISQLFKSQIEKITEEIDELAASRKLIETLSDLICSVQDVDEAAITVQHLPSAPIVLGDWNIYEEGDTSYEALARFYDSVSKKYKRIDLNYPVWGIFTPEKVAAKMAGEEIFPERYYFYTPDGPDKRPAGLYVAGYSRGNYGDSLRLYLRVKDYLDKNNLEICGNTYEEYPLNELSIADKNSYLMRILMSVCKKEA